jgi:hypothetical protein
MSFNKIFIPFLLASVLLFAQQTINGVPAVIAGVPSTMVASCTGAVTNNATIVLFPFQGASSTCISTTAFQGPNWPALTFKNLRVVVGTLGTVGGGVVTFYKNGVAQTLTCTLSTASTCTDLTHSFTTNAGDFATVKVTSAGGTLTTGPTYSSGASACTNGTQVVTFSNGTSGVAPVNALGTITVSGGVPTGAVTMTNTGAGYTAATPPTNGTVATCTGTTVFTGGTVTVDALANVIVTYQTY